MLIYPLADGLIWTIQQKKFDLIIGASAIANRLILVTDNTKHFKNFENIKIENWLR